MTDTPTPANETPNDSGTPPVPPGMLLLEPVPVPVTDIERAKAFYQDQLGYRSDVDVNPKPGIRIVQLTHPVRHARSPPPTVSPPSTCLWEPCAVCTWWSPTSRRPALNSSNAASRSARSRTSAECATRTFADPDGNTWYLQHMPWR
jgi:hypothetical protein